MIFVVKKSWIEVFIEGTEENFRSIESYLKDEIELDMIALRNMYLI